ncbi:hypothetical protein ORIO_18765 [Cereibacter azotoformans]|uniref:DUF2786 domain-containing protein n=1 Tax=Cereibacter sphaeroides (strain ATCC 17025 / ATH 2.4.3) TaxID=349102 RepID=A4WYE8_CERS5|nr:hypothetical protein [Cereibacter azotoformans]ULB11872.1 hypothetical protein ORIO_18765 [Cereibacter azotoformans]
MAGDEDIRMKLAKLEALFARGATAGERAAAGAALDRLQARIAAEAPSEPETEVQYSMPDSWSVRIFVALCRKHGVRPYRYPRQRRTTIMVRARASEFERTVLAEFQTLHSELVAYFDGTVDHLIADAMKSYGDDATLDVRPIGR